MGILKKFRFWPEVVSVLTGAAWISIFLALDPWFGGWQMYGLSFLFALLSACFYRMRQRPRMRIHFLCFLSPVVIVPFVVAVFYDTLYLAWVHEMFLIICVLTIFILLSILPVCIVYELLYAKRFAEPKFQERVEP